MNYSYTASYISPKDMKQKLKNDALKNNTTKIISIFFILSFSWFCYTMYKMIPVLF